MQCPKCGTELTRNNIRADGCLECPGCRTVYQRKKQPDTPSSTGQRRVNVSTDNPPRRPTVSSSSIINRPRREEPTNERTRSRNTRSLEQPRTSNERIGHTSRDFNRFALILCIFGLLLFIIRFELNLGSILAVAAAVLLLGVIWIDRSIPSVSIAVPMFLLLAKDFYNHFRFSRIELGGACRFLIFAVITLTVVIWLYEERRLPLGKKAIVALMLVRYIVDILVVLIIIADITSLISPGHGYAVNLIGDLMIWFCITKLQAPAARQCRAMKGSLLTVVFLIYIFALALGIVGSIATQEYAEILDEIKHGNEMFGSDLFNYAFDQMAEFSVRGVYVMWGCCIAIIVAAIGFIIVNFLIQGKNPRYYPVFIVTCAIVVIALATHFIVREEYLTGIISALGAAAVAVAFSLYFRRSPTVQEYFDID